MSALGARRRLFNRVTVVLITAWVLLVGIIAATSERASPADPEDVHAFIERLL